MKSFTFSSRDLPVTFIETFDVTKGVTCDVYTFDGDTDKDLGIIRIAPGKKTPLQKVLQGDRTIEGHISGRGKLVIVSKNGETHVYKVNESTKKSFHVDINIGETMQWHSDPDSELVVYEVCFPPYEDGRYENIDE